MNNNSDDSSNWKMGFIYFNKENKKVFVPKRLGIGWTLNFARWQSLLIIALLLMSIAFAILKPFR